MRKVDLQPFTCVLVLSETHLLTTCKKLNPKNQLATTVGFPINFDIIIVLLSCRIVTKLTRLLQYFYRVS